ncbi:MAG TPA: DUF2059 domain-containing protein [Kiritimatiellia bacterium]|nr:DUF2059 domain-containing protein [Kiritimatiellia bacterium]
MKIVVALIASLSMSFGVMAESPSRMELAVDLVKAMDYCRVLDKSFDDIRDAQIKQMSRMGAGMTEDTIKELNRTFELIRELMDCDSMIQDVAGIYADLFNEKELKGLTAFYQSEVGRRYSELLPEITKRSMLISSERVGKAMPGIMRKVQEERSTDK